MIHVNEYNISQEYQQQMPGYFHKKCAIIEKTFVQKYSPGLVGFQSQLHKYIKTIITMALKAKTYMIFFTKF